MDFLGPSTTPPQPPLHPAGPYPTHEALRAPKTPRYHNPEAIKLLFWPLNADTPAALETSGLAVMATGPKHPNPDELTPYWDTTAGTWHPISKVPISEPKVSEIIVRVAHVRDWKRNWDELHWECQLEDNLPPPSERGEGWGEGRCRGCGAKRPPIPEGDVHVVVKGTGRTRRVSDSTSGGGYFVTVHDYVSAVHPWLVGLRGDILGALGQESLDYSWKPLPVETELMVGGNALDVLYMQKRAEWIRRTKKLPVPESPGFSFREMLEQSGEAHLGPFGGFPPFMQHPRKG